MFTFLEQEDIYHLIINRTAMAMSRAISAHFRQRNIPITKEQFSILVVLWKQDGCTQQHLATQTFRDKPGVTRLIDNLEKEKLVVRKSSSKDRRSNLIFLTEKGRSLEEEVVKSVKETIKRAVVGISEEDASKLKEILGRVYNNLEKTKI